MKLNKHLIIIGSVILLVLGSLIWQSTQQSKPRQLGGDFTLPTSTGDLTLSDFRGQAVMLFFGYTSCPDVCPANMATMRQVLNNLSPELNGKVKGLFVTVDPERDSLAHVASYAAFFHADIAAAGGSKAQIDQVVAQYGAFYQKEASESAMGYLVNHTAATYLIDPQGQIAGLIRHDESYRDILNKLTVLFE